MFHNRLLLFCRSSLGPAAVLDALPLQLAEGLSGAAEARTWLLPALRRHVRAAALDVWAQRLLPDARSMGAAAGAASAAGRKAAAVACHALEVQLWSCLPAFCCWPSDAAQAYPGEGKHTHHQHHKHIYSYVLHL
jgi:ribosomal RNA-processing protein 12